MDLVPKMDTPNARRANIDVNIDIVEANTTTNELIATQKVLFYSL